MLLSNEKIAKFQALYKRQFGMEITRKEACEQGARLMRLVEIIYQPMSQAEYQQLQGRRNETCGK